MEHYQPTPENLIKLHNILRENATDCANTCEVDMSKETKKALNARWRERLKRMREIDRAYCEAHQFKMYD